MKKKHFNAPNYLIDGNSGEILKQWDKTPVIEAFAEVGVVCPMHKS
nr:hypothetical protein [Legionella pneumophila]